MGGLKFGRQLVIFSLLIVVFLLCSPPAQSFSHSCYDIFSYIKPLGVMPLEFSKVPSLRLEAPKEFVPTQINSNGRVVLFRGDLRGMEFKGILSDAYRRKDMQAIEVAAEVVKAGNYQDIIDLMLSHADPNVHSPFVRASLSPVLAQVNAKGSLRRNVNRDDQTIYRIEVNPNRVIQFPVRDGRSGLKYVTFILGMVTPAEITGYKIYNTESESELLYEKKAGEFVEAETFSEHPASQEPIHQVLNPANWTWSRKKNQFF